MEQNLDISSDALSHILGSITRRHVGQELALNEAK